MHAVVGDRLLVHSAHVDVPARVAEVVEVRHEDGSPPYLVRWADTGHETLIYPGADAEVQHVEHLDESSD
jgi:hypothetical protein